MTHGALFNGIAGFPLAAAWAGIETAWTVEIDEFCNKVSKKHFPNAIQYTDIHQATNLPYVDIISGGFPCQPFSVAGKQLGNEDDRALWPEMLRIIKEVKPAYVIGENVTGIINLALDEVLTSLEIEGYTTETFIVPANAVGAPHKRDRVWIIAYTVSKRYRGWDKQSNRVTQWQICKSSQERAGLAGEITGCCSPFTNSDNQRCQKCNDPGISAIPGRDGRNDIEGRIRKPDFRLTESPVCGPNDGVPSGLVRDRAKQLKAYGNAIVPQVAYEIFKAINELELVP